MSGNIKQSRSSGVTLVELVVVITVGAILIVPTVTVMFGFYSNTIKNNLQARLAVESQNILRSVVEELRVSSGVRAINTIVDSNAPGGSWTTSNANLVLIISTPVLDSSNDFVIDPSTGYPYQNELVYFAENGKLYKRYLANSAATGNRYKTSCPAALATATCPADVKLSDNFKTMSFLFYDQDNNATTTLADARSINLTIQMERKTFGQTIEFANNIRITLRNSD